ncbi:osteopontin [Hemibagrus wyckioides]|nr:osteopontin [Hemibagrus wyckioides]
MKAVIVFMLLFAAVYCHPVKRSASSSSESADVQPVDTQDLKVSAVADVSSEEDPDDDDDDEDESDSDESDENGPTSSPPFFETTIIPIVDGRGDSMGYQSDYKKNVYYVDGNNIEKGPSSYKSYGSDKTQYDGEELKVYKALQVQNVGLDQGMDASSGTDSEDMSQQEQKAASTGSPSEESDEDSQSSEENTTEATTTESNSSESSEETNASQQPALLKSGNPEVIIA